MDNQELRKVGLKVTVPRVKILKILEEAKHPHLSAEEVFHALRDMGEVVGLATVYRVLTQFEEAGLIIRHNFEGDSAVFELDQGGHHDHMVCMKCGRIVEFVDEMIEARQEEIVKQHQFKMTDHNLIIYGTCQRCHT